MEIHNRDLFPPEDVKKLYSAAEPLIVNSIVDASFAEHERIAVAAKNSYHLRGRLAAVLVLISVLFTIAESLVIPSSRGLRFAVVPFLAMGVIGLAIQLHLLITKKKQMWLLHRFAAERLRSMKFQAYPLAMSAATREQLEHQTGAFYKEETARLEMELNAGEAALQLFSPARAVTQSSTRLTAVNAAIADAARDAYRELRIAYQRRFATGEIQKLQNQQRIGYTSADILYLSGTSLAIASLVSISLFPNATVISHWIDFLAVAAFIVGLMNTIMDNASLAETSRARYEEYLRALQECEGELAAESAKFPEVVRRIERVALEELNDFCSAASRISYRL